MKNKILSILLSIGCFYTANGQTTNLSCIDSIKITPPTSVSIDRSGMIYYANKKGSLRKYDEKLKLQAEFSPQSTGSIDLIEAWNPLRILVFYEARQEYLFLDRFLVASTSYSLQSITDYAGLVSSSLDNNIWIADLTDFGLKKYNLKFNQVTINTPFDLLLNPQEYNLTHLREYKNMLFLGDSDNGILVFDNLGNHIKNMPARGVQYFNFLNEEIYYLKEGKIVFINIYTGKRREIKSGILSEALYALATENRIFVFYNDKIKSCQLIN